MNGRTVGICGGLAHKGFPADSFYTFKTVILTDAAAAVGIFAEAAHPEYAEKNVGIDRSDIFSSMNV